MNMKDAILNLYDTKLRKQFRENPALPSTIIGATAFSSSLALSTFTQHKLLHVSTATKAPIPTLLGLTTVALASLATHATSKSSFDYFTAGKLPQYQTILQSYTFTHDKLKRRRDANNMISIPYTSFCIPKKPTLQVALLGLLSFQILGGRFWTISPSSYTHLGSFARVPFSLPASLGSYATKSERVAIEKLGRRFGCHTCGSRRILSRTGEKVKAKFYADHMPPNAIVKRCNEKTWRKVLNYPMKQRFYPQCVTCSTKQSNILSRGTNMKEWTAKGMSYFGKKSELSYSHAGKFRLHHFLTGSVVGGTTVFWEKEDDFKIEEFWKQLKAEFD